MDICNSAKETEANEEDESVRTVRKKLTRVSFVLNYEDDNVSKASTSRSSRSLAAANGDGRQSSSPPSTSGVTASSSSPGPNIAVASTSNNSRSQPHPSFFSVSVAACEANLTLPNTKLGYGIIEQNILDSLTSFRPLDRSASFSQLEALINSVPPSPLPSPRPKSGMKHSRSCYFRPPRAKTAGGAAGEDRVQVVSSEDQGLLFCAIFDGFNGRDAADFLAATLFERVSQQLAVQNSHGELDCELESSTEEKQSKTDEQGRTEEEEIMTLEVAPVGNMEPEAVIRALKEALAEAEAAFLAMVAQELAERSEKCEKFELAMVGSCVLVVLVCGEFLYTMNLGDSRAILGTEAMDGKDSATSRTIAVQLSRDHSVSVEEERERLLAAHRDDPEPIRKGRVKGKVDVTRAFGAGYLKSAELNNKVPHYMKVKDLTSPPYISSEPDVHAHKIKAGEDQFVVMASDGLFEFLKNEEAVKYVNHCMQTQPNTDPARYLLDELLFRVSRTSGKSIEYLNNLPLGRRRDFHDDVTVMVVNLRSSNP